MTIRNHVMLARGAYSFEVIVFDDFASEQFDVGCCRKDGAQFEASLLGRAQTDKAALTDYALATFATYIEKWERHKHSKLDVPTHREFIK